MGSRTLQVLVLHTRRKMSIIFIYQLRNINYLSTSVYLYAYYRKTFHEMMRTLTFFMLTDKLTKSEQNEMMNKTEDYLLHCVLN